MISRKTAEKNVKKSVLTGKRALMAAKAVKKAYADKFADRSPAWKKGGRQWLRVLGHFGHFTNSSSGK
jgi:hypothetical protein